MPPIAGCWQAFNALSCGLDVHQLMNERMDDTSPKNLVRLAPGLLDVGKPLPWPVFNENGQLLVAQGHVIQNEGQLERLYELGRYDPPQRWERPVLEEDTDVEALDDVDPFHEYGALLVELERMAASVASREEDAQTKITSLAKRIHVLCRSDKDAALALIHVYSVKPTAYEQTLFHGILSWFMAQKLSLKKDQLVTLMAAAVTANLALLPYQDKLNQSRSTLTEAQREIIRKHPERSARALEAAGMENRVCLEVIRQHHEKSDGTGYPRGLKGDAIMKEARIIAAAERYVAMITRRAYRSRCRADEALRSIIASATEPADRAVVQALYKTLGRYPPGALVKLKNDETAVVIHRPKADKPVDVRVLLTAQGHPYLNPFPRDTEQDEWRVDRVVVPDVLPALDLPALWGYG